MLGIEHGFGLLFCVKRSEIQSGSGQGREVPIRDRIFMLNG